MESGDLAERTGSKAVACAITFDDAKDSTQTSNINTNFRVLCRDKGPPLARLSDSNILSDVDCKILQHFEFKMSVAPKSLWVHMGLPSTYPSKFSYMLTSY